MNDQDNNNNNAEQPPPPQPADPIGNIMDKLGDKFLEQYEQLEVPSNLPDGTYFVVVTKSEVLPVTRSGGETIQLKFSAKVKTPVGMADKIFIFDFTLSENNMQMMKQTMFNLGFEFDISNQLRAFACLPGTELEISISTKGEYKNKYVNRLVVPGEVLSTFLRTVSTPETL